MFKDKIWYIQTMWGFSKKRFFVTLGISVGVWVVSGVIQALTGFPQYFTVFHKCSLTGYPIALCLSSNDQIKVVLVSGANILIWFWIIHLFWGWFQKRNN